MHDLIIVGAGPAGLTAAIYAARFKLDTLIISEDTGGLVLEAHKVENYPGFKSIKGVELANRLKEQADALGVEIKTDIVKGIVKKKNGFEIITDSTSYKAKSVILAIGTRKRKLNIPKEEQFLGKGVSYCAVCDAPLFKDKIVGVVGGSNCATMSALMLAEHAKKVYIIYRKEKIRAEPILCERIEKNDKIEILTNSNVIDLKGGDFLEGIKLDTGKEIRLEGLFVEVGYVPNIALLKNIGIKINESGYIVVNAAQKTSMDGIYAAGDITTSSNEFRQIVTAVSEGAIAAQSVFRFIKTK